jgi:hypothetical protein
MHPRDLQNQALVAAGNAHREGFTGTAEAFKLMAMICAEEARDLLVATATEAWLSRPRQPEAAH